MKRNDGDEEGKSDDPYIEVNQKRYPEKGTLDFDRKLENINLGLVEIQSNHERFVLIKVMDQDRWSEADELGSIRMVIVNKGGSVSVQYVADSMCQIVEQKDEVCSFKLNGSDAQYDCKLFFRKVTQDDGKFAASHSSEMIPSGGPRTSKRPARLGGNSE